MTQSERAAIVLKDFSDVLDQINIINATPVIENHIDHAIMVIEQQIINIKEELAK